MLRIIFDKFQRSVTFSVQKCERGPEVCDSLLGLVVGMGLSFIHYLAVLEETAQVAFRSQNGCPKAVRFPPLVFSE